MVALTPRDSPGDPLRNCSALFIFATTVLMDLCFLCECVTSRGGLLLGHHDRLPGQRRRHLQESG